MKGTSHTRPIEQEPSLTAPSDVLLVEPPVERGWGRLASAAGRPVSAQSVAVFRMVFGAVGLWSAVRLLANGWVDSLYAGPALHLAYPGLGWVPVLPGPAMRVQVVVIALSAAAVMVGYRYRIAAVVFWISFAWLEFTEASVYLNHYWFITVMGALMIVLPMATTWSLDARRAAWAATRSAVLAVAPEPAPVGGARTVPVGVVWLVRAQVAVVYCFAGLAKLQGDWLGRGLPMALWLPARSDLPVVGELLTHASTARALSWAGAAFDCAVVLFLLWRRTRPWAWAAVVSFHVATWILFPIIGLFPWLMIGASMIFFDPDWPGRLLDRVRGRTHVLAPSSSEPDRLAPAPAPAPVTWQPVRTVALVAALAWMAVQVILPMRHVLYPGDHRWTGEAYRFGWNVLLVEKAGDLVFRVTDTTTGVTSRTDAMDLYTPQQWRTMVNEPELIRQAAHAVAEQVAEERQVPLDRIQVRADAFVSFNGRASVRLVDPRVDLAAEPWRLGHQTWIEPAPTTPPPRRT